jgi:hypothetical protein
MATRDLYVPVECPGHTTEITRFLHCRYPMKVQANRWM